MKLASVAYCNTDSLTKKDGTEKLCWSTVTNTLLHGAAHDSNLTGYIKDMAWSYEKEVRIRAELGYFNNYDRIAIELPEKVIDSMIITASPLFEGNLEEQLSREIKRQLLIDTSLFEGRLNIKTICKECNLKKNAVV